MTGLKRTPRSRSGFTLVELIVVLVILGVLAVIAGSVIVFLAARALGRNAVQRFLDKGVMDKYLPVIEEKQDMFLFLTMLFPFFPDDALCMLAGLTNISLGRIGSCRLIPSRLVQRDNAT